MLVQAGLIAIVTVLALTSICLPSALSDAGNSFLRGFVNQELLATLGDLQPPLLQAQVTGEPFFALAQYSAYGCVNISVLY